LALTHLSRGRSGEATDLADALAANLLEIENAESIALARAFRAELLVRQGRLAEAWRWAEQFDPEPLAPAYMFYVPQVTLAKLLIARGDPQSLRRADGLLERLHGYFERTHNRRVLIDVLALRALLLDAQDDEPGALSALEQAVALAQTGGFTRVFADIGPGLANQLHRLELDEAGVQYVGRILSAFPGGRRADLRSASIGPRERPPGIDSLSRREAEVLSLLAERLTNPEISERLHISTVTVKRHVANIFQKLGVHDRRAAVSTAIGLRILTP
jgi:LuxR family maltose regulon positive regulatory protein